MKNDDAYENGAYIPGGADYPSRWAAASEAFAAAHPAREIAYGPGPRQRLSLFAPEGAARGLMVFVHGGYWRRFDRSDFLFLAAGALARGWAVAMPSYTLAPEARIAEITREVAAAITSAAAQVPGPITLAGHSAGGHLVARMCCAGVLGEDVAARIARVVPISPVSDLRPLLETSLNADLRLDAAEAVAESPALLPRAIGADVHVWVGGGERPAFLDQARWLAQGWNCPLTITPDEHHFNVIDGLAASDGALLAAVLGAGG